MKKNVNILISSLSQNEKNEFLKFIISNKIHFVKDKNSNKYFIYINLINPNYKEKNYYSQSKNSFIYKNTYSPNAVDIKRKIFYTKKYSNIYSKFFNNLNLIIGICEKKINFYDFKLLIEEIYSKRFNEDSINLKNQFDKRKKLNDLKFQIKLNDSFPDFVYNFLKNKNINKISIDRMCMNFLCSLEYYKSKYEEINNFSYFLSEYYNNDDLIFFLFIRNCIEKEIGLNFIEKAEDDIILQKKQYLMENLIDTEIYLNKKMIKNIANIIYGKDESILINYFIDKFEDGISANYLLNESLKDYHNNRISNEKQNKNLQNFIINNQIRENNNYDNDDIENENEIINNKNEIENNNILIQNNFKLNGNNIKICPENFDSQNNNDNNNKLKSINNFNINNNINNSNKNNKELINELLTYYFGNNILINLFATIFNDLPLEIKLSENFKIKLKELKEILIQKYSYIIHCLLYNTKEVWFNFFNININDQKAEKLYNHLSNLINNIIIYENVSEIPETMIEEFSKCMLLNEHFMEQIMSLIDKNFIFFK